MSAESADKKMLSRAAMVAKQEIFVSFAVLLSLLADVALGEKLCKRSVNLVGMVHCVQSVSFSDFDRFLCKDDIVMTSIIITVLFSSFLVIPVHVLTFVFFPFFSKTRSCESFVATETGQ